MFLALIALNTMFSFHCFPPFIKHKIDRLLSVGAIVEIFFVVSVALFAVITTDLFLRGILYERSAFASYKTVFTDVHNFAFDETCGVYQIYQKNRITCFDERIFADISKIYHRYRLALNDKNYDYQLFCWNDGHIYRYYLDGDIKKDEFIYIHFKERGMLPFDRDCINALSFYITYSGFYSCDVSNISVEDFQRYNTFEGTKKEKKELKNYVKQERKKKIISKLNLLLHRQEKLR